MRICCPPHKHACHYGIDFPDPEKLLANQCTLDQIRDYLGADSIGYLDVDGMVRATGQTREDSASPASTATTRSPSIRSSTSSSWNAGRAASNLLAGEDEPSRPFRPDVSNQKSKIKKSKIPEKAYAAPAWMWTSATSSRAGIHARVKVTHGPEVLGKIGGFGGLFQPELQRHEGSGARLQRRWRRHETEDRLRDEPPRHRRPGSREPLHQRHRRARRAPAVLSRLHRRGKARAARLRAAHQAASPRPARQPAARSSAAKRRRCRACINAANTISQAPSSASSIARKLIDGSRIKPGDVDHRARLERPAHQRLLARAQNSLRHDEAQARRRSCPA